MITVQRNPRPKPRRERKVIAPRFAWPDFELLNKLCNEEGRDYADMLGRALWFYAQQTQTKQEAVQSA